MNGKVIVGIVAVVVIALGAYFLLSGDDAGYNNTGDNDTAQQDTNDTAQNDVVIRGNEAGDTVVVERAQLASNGFVVIYVMDSAGNTEVVGTSRFLSAGTHTDVIIELDESVAADATLVAVLHEDNGDESFDSETDGYLLEDGAVVVDADVVGVVETEEDASLAADVEAVLDAEMGDMMDDMEDTMDKGTTEDTQDTVDDSTDTSDVVEINVTGESFAFSRDTITVEEGQTVRLTFTSTGGSHDFVIDEFSGARTSVLQTGESETIEFVADAAGTYDFYCSVGSHRSLGMEGSFIVQ